MMLIFAGVLIHIFLPIFVRGDACIDDCDANYNQGSRVIFCGSNGITYNTTNEAVIKSTCYTLCGVTVFHEGPCGCPNECYSNIMQGSCIDGECVCSSGWTGQDCSLPSVGHKCSLHGKLISSNDGAFPFEYCDCDDGWSGIDCSSHKMSIGNAPWGTMFDIDPYTKDDEYKDDHPVFDVERIHTIRIEIADEDYFYLLNVTNLYNESYRPATFYYDNGKDRATIENVGLRVKGSSSRMDQKKGWYVKFNEYVSGQKLFDLKKIGLKGGCVADDTFVKQKLYSDFFRACGLPVQRSSYALLYVNRIFMGLYELHEDIDTQFLQSRLHNDDGSGHLMKMAHNVHLGYFGDDVEYYKSKSHTNKLGVTLYYYTPESDGGDESYTDLIEFLDYFNRTTSMSDFEASVEQWIDVKYIFSSLALEAFLVGADQFTEGNNFFIYHYHSEDGGGEQTDQRMMLLYDFDELLNVDLGSNEFSEEDPDIFAFYATDISDYEDYSPLTTMLFRSQKYKQQYLSVFSTILETLFGSNSKQQPTDRFGAIMQFILPWVEKDRMWQLAYAMTPQLFLTYAERTIANLPLRYRNVTAQIAQYSAEMH